MVDSDDQEHFGGVMTLADGKQVRVELVVTPEVLEVHSEGATVGAWPLRYCRVSRMASGEYELSIDGEEVGFAPADPERFGLMAVRRFEASSLADRINVIRDIPVPDAATQEGTGPGVSGLTGRKVSRPVQVLTALVVLGLVSAVLAFVIGNRDSGPGIVVVTTSTTEAATETLDPFAHPPSVFVEEWNRKAGEFSAPVRIRDRTVAGGFEVRLTPRLTLQGTVDDSGNLESLVFSADPTGSSEDDQLIIAAWGVALAVVDPTLDAPGRRALLRELGLDLDDMSLEGLEGETERGHIRYSLTYLQEFTTALFTISRR